MQAQHLCSDIRRCDRITRPHGHFFERLKMQLHIGTKQITAQPMTRQAYNDYRGWTLPADEGGTDEGYLVEYLDGGRPNHPAHAGYISWSPKARFDAAYHPTTGMTFGLAIEALKAGKRVARDGWNGKGLWVEYVPAKDFSFSELNPHFVIKNTNNSFSTWVPSINDCLADDWQIVG